MKHPNPDCQESQAEFLRNCPEEQREFHERMFRIGNATYIYHQQVESLNDKELYPYYLEWLEGLPAHISADMKNRGFEQCKFALSFTRYVNERKDIGLDEWMKEHLSEEDYKFTKEVEERNKELK